MAPRKPDNLTFIEEARRKQLVEVAIETIASAGFMNTTLADIARRADISKGVISYHFENKDKLIDEVIRTLLRASYEFIHARVEATPDNVPEKLRAYIIASFDYIMLHPTRAAAQVDLWGSFVSAEAKHDFNVTAYDPCRRYLSALIAAGQERGEIRDMPPLILAALIQGIIDGMMMQWVFAPEAINLTACAEHAISMVNAYAVVSLPIT